MDLLFLSRRIFLGDGSHDDDVPIHGGIIVDTEGIIRRGGFYPYLSRYI